MEAPPIKQERSGSSHGGVTIDSIYYYGKSVYQDVNLRSYFGSIRPPTRLTFGFRLGRCIIINFPKRTFIHFFLPRRPRRLKRREKSRPGKEKGRWWAFGKVGPIGCLHSSDDTEEERNEVRGRGAGKRVESIRLDDREKQNEIRIWPKKKQRRLKVLSEPCWIVTHHTALKPNLWWIPGDKVKALDPLPHTLRCSSPPIKQRRCL
ncbi:Ribosomal protein S3, mitochondrial [Morella rubra]|uniref:Ribosomal protein S3, mitochondrial n=1 Tax=Morella rubra TaxID=262757 RepID=A0A6A1WT88_9ROSI|nr:Ribosomal protein S3, mitochondrial [Morella rubra]